MYIPRPFQQTDFEQIKAFITEYPLATIVAKSDNEMVISGLKSCHVPLFWQEGCYQESIELENDNEDFGVLVGHIAKVNPLLKMMNSHWLVIFQDSGQYISPNWYPEKAKTHKTVPTWNYRSVHFTVKPTLITDSNELKKMVGKLSDIHEANEQQPWSIDEAPEKFIEAMCKGIVGFRLKIIDVKAQFKLSQNKDEATKESIVKNLCKLDTSEGRKMADLIENL